MKPDEIAKVNNELIDVRNELERIGRSICSVPCSSPAWGAITEAVSHVSRAVGRVSGAIGNLYRMTDEAIEKALHGEQEGA